MRSEKEKMLAGEAYNSADPELVEAHWRAQDMCRLLNETPAPHRQDRRQIMQKLFGSVTDDAHIHSPFFCDYGSNIFLGKKAFFNFNCVILDVCEVRIGDYCFFGPGVHIYTATHPLDPMLRRELESGKPVTIGDDVWVGGGAIICPGVSIGSKSVIGAGSVVTRDIPEGVFAAGNPCRVIRKIVD